MLFNRRFGGLIHRSSELMDISGTKLYFYAVEGVAEYDHVVFAEVREVVQRAIDGQRHKVATGLFGRTLVIGFGPGHPYVHAQILSAACVEMYLVDKSLLPEDFALKSTREDVLSHSMSIFSATHLYERGSDFGGGEFGFNKQDQPSIGGDSLAFGTMPEKPKSLALEFLGQYREFLKQDAV